MNISAVLLAGGESRRMGADKSLLLFRGRPLWQIQLELLRGVQPAEIFVSARDDPAWRPRDTEFVADDPPSRGPLGGLVASLRRMNGDQLLVLAIDMPFMAVEHLNFLLNKISPGRGVLPMIEDRAEPLAAIYPASCRDGAMAALAADQLSLQALCKNLLRARMLSAFSVSAADVAFYRNLNEPADVDAGPKLC